MEPKFQSSFIPKGPIATTSTASKISRQSEHSLLGTLASLVFAVTVLAAVGLFGYGWLLSRQIGSMGQSLSDARSSLEPSVIKSITDLNDRITSTKEILNKHLAISPAFALLEKDTLKTVRYTNYDLNNADNTYTLTLKGQARGYDALALQASIFQSEPMLKNPVFSNLDLDNKGNVTFTFQAQIDASALLYKTLVTPAAGTPLQGQQNTSTSNAVIATSTSVSTKVSTSTSTSTKP